MNAQGGRQRGDWNPFDRKDKEQDDQADVWRRWDETTGDGGAEVRRGENEIEDEDDTEDGGAEEE